MKNYSLQDLIQMLNHLRGPQGCSWDKEQTAKSLQKYIIEEAYELVAAIENGSIQQIKEELGDLLLQVIFQSQIADEQGHFKFDDVTHTLGCKLVRRHPHIFESPAQLSPKEVSIQWQQIKQTEEPNKQSALAEQAKGLPGLAYAHKIQKEAARKGFDWPTWQMAFERVQEELEQVHQAISKETQNKLQEGLGDLLFAIVGLIRKLDFDPELTLLKVCFKFCRRFDQM